MPFIHFGVILFKCKKMNLFKLFKFGHYHLVYGCAGVTRVNIELNKVKMVTISRLFVLLSYKYYVVY